MFLADFPESQLARLAGMATSQHENRAIPQGAGLGQRDAVFFVIDEALVFILLKIHQGTLRRQS